MYCSAAKNLSFPLFSGVPRRSRCSKPSLTRFGLGSFSSPSLENGRGLSSPRNSSTGCRRETLESTYGMASYQVVLESLTHGNGRKLTCPVGFYQERIAKSGGGLKCRSFSCVLHQRAQGNTVGVECRVPVNGPHRRATINYNALPLQNIPSVIRQETLRTNLVVKFGNLLSNGFHHPKAPSGDTYGVRSRGFSDSSLQKTVNNAGGRGTGKALPWITTYSDGEKKGLAAARISGSSWEDSANSYFSKNGGKSMTENSENRIRTIRGPESNRRSYTKENEEENKEEDKKDDDEPVNDPRWNRIKSKYDRYISRESRYEKPEVARWNKQESWGKKTWKEATESSVPKMVGEGVYGVGPVLAALTVGRRDFYALYVQEGLDLSGNNRKKKDKKGVERILKMAEKIGLSVKEISKHDLNMIVDNRPHQGLVLDASPLEMVGIRELDPVLVNKGDKAPLWVALDEVTDPQNLGAILRSAYFFGVEGVVLCAKNSAPLSGVVSKASAGSLELIELRSCKNMMQFLASSVENGWRILGGSVSSKALPLSEVEAGPPTILVLGSEGIGLRPLVERSCTQLIKIPGNFPVDVHAGGNGEVEGEEMDKNCSALEFKSFLAVESLNVSVAAGVLLYHLVGNNIHVDEKQT